MLKLGTAAAWTAWKGLAWMDKAGISCTMFYRPTVPTTDKNLRGFLNRAAGRGGSPAYPNPEIISHTRKQDPTFLPVLRYWIMLIFHQ